MLPRPHHFNAAGTHQAVHLVTMSGVFVALRSSVIGRLLAAPPGATRQKAALRRRSSRGWVRAGRTVTTPRSQQTTTN